MAEHDHPADGLNEPDAGLVSEPGADIDEDGVGCDPHAAAGARGREPSQVRFALAVMVPVITVLAGIAGWQVYGALQVRESQIHEQVMLQAGRQVALNLTTIDFADVDSGIKAVLDTTTGQFHGEFASNAEAFADTVRKAQAKTVGKITEAGIESTDKHSARVLVTAAVSTTNVVAAEQEPRLWRMRLTVESGADGVKVSDVGFVP